MVISNSALSRSKLRNLDNHLVNSLSLEFLETWNISGASIGPFETQARSLVEFLNRGFAIRIQEIVLDFMRDKHGRVWFCACKTIRIDPDALNYSVKPFKPELVCALCRLKFAPQQLLNKLSYRMLALFSQHALNRQKFRELIEYSDKERGESARVCMQCYELVYTELDLMDLERHLARYIHTGDPKPAPKGTLNVPNLV